MKGVDGGREGRKKPEWVGKAWGCHGNWELSAIRLSTAPPHPFPVLPSLHHFVPPTVFLFPAFLFPFSSQSFHFGSLRIPRPRPRFSLPHPLIQLLASLPPAHLATVFRWLRLSPKSPEEEEAREAERRVKLNSSETWEFFRVFHQTPDDLLLFTRSA